jgi:transposase-like protein
MGEEIRRSTACPKWALILDVIQGKITVSESSRQFDLPPSEIESWIGQAKAGTESALRAKREDIRGQYESHL